MDSAASIVVASVIASNASPIMTHDGRCLERIRETRDIRDIMKESIWTACD